MTQNAKTLVRRIYYTIITVALIAVAVMLMVQCVAIYRLGDSPFTRESIAAHFAPIAVPVYVCIGVVVAGFALSPLLPKEPDGKPDRDNVTLRRLQDKVDLSACPEELRYKVLRQRNRRSLHHTITLSLLAVGTAVFLWYALNVDRFPLQDATGAMVRAMWVLLPCVGVPFLYAVSAAYICRGSVRKEIALLRGAQTNATSANNSASCRKTRNDRLVPVVRGVVLAAAIGLTVYGLLYNGAMDVLWKAVNICQECIGLG